jgi:hypothetical protein
MAGGCIATDGLMREDDAVVQLLDEASAALVHRRGDFVRLVRDEQGEDAMGRRGDWGRIEEVAQTGALTIKIAGYSRPPQAEIARLSDIPRSLVEPCDGRGRPTSAKARPLTRADSNPTMQRAASAPPPKPSGPSLLLVASVGGVLALGAAGFLFFFGGP